MSNILSSKPKLAPDIIDVSVGEPHIVRDTLFKVFDMSLYELPKVPHMYEYPSPNGYDKLVKLLEDKHQAPVIITNGAKQALGACFYALYQMNKKLVGMKLPYWALIPPLINMHGLGWAALDPQELKGCDSYLLLAPNNPDGYLPDAQGMINLAQEAKDKNIPLIHDAAYYTHTYIPGSHTLPPVGDVQIYSISKMLGLSGLRLGYVVCHNKEFYKLIMQYMETMTVGVSMISQIFLFDLMNRMEGYPTLTDAFEGLSQSALQENKALIKQIDSEILEVPSNMEDIPGMFGWFKVGPKADFEKAKVNFIDGFLFGVPGMVRMNLAFSNTQMQEIINRINISKI